MYYATGKEHRSSDVTHLKVLCAYEVISLPQSLSECELLINSTHNPVRVKSLGRLLAVTRSGCVFRGQKNGESK